MVWPAWTVTEGGAVIASHVRAPGGWDAWVTARMLVGRNIGYAELMAVDPAAIVVEYVNTAEDRTRTTIHRRGGWSPVVATQEAGV